MSPSPKPTFEDFVRTCTPLLKIPELEAKMREKVREIVSRLLCFEAGEDATENVTRFLREDDTFFGVMLSMVNLSQEKFLRILTAERFADGDFGGEWGINQVIRKIRKDDDFAKKIARLFLEGRENALLAEKVADFYLDQLSLLEDWTDVIRNKGAVARIVRNKLAGEYTDAKGKFIEARIRKVLDKLKGITYEKGQIPLLGKEADHAFPPAPILW